ncbi:SlyX [Pannonibacter phragmitetus]|uniref:SlyX n=1 Tax=Pannonibacter phragmitetus TaxID=121719 RepID=A0A378ZRM1_9HYPH|nr:SlyX family protein [Pannonibacter phragmitetus]SUA99854.1 SlyX [Pannonibacter phragmitetus]
MMDEDRVVNLEIGLAHAIRTIDDLNAVVIEQGRQIERLTRKLREMTDQIDELIETGVSAHPVTRPPHY